MGHVFQAEWWGKHPNGCWFGLLWLRKWKRLWKGKEALICILFMKLMEIRKKGRWKVTSCMWGENWRKTMENEENRGLIDKKASEDQLVTFCQFTFGSLPLFSLSYSWRLRVLLEHSWWVWHTWIIWARRKINSRKAEEGIKSIATWYFLVGTELHVCFLH